MPVMIALIVVDFVVVLLLLIYGTRGEDHEEMVQTEESS